MPAGWYTDEIYQSNDDAANTKPDVYSFGNSGNTERSLGSTNPASVYGVSYRNMSGKVLILLLLQYTGEQWSKGGSSTPGNEDAMHVSYSVNATSLRNGTWSPLIIWNLRACKQEQEQLC